MPLSKAKLSRYPLELVSTKGELCPHYCHHPTLRTAPTPKIRIRTTYAPAPCGSVAKISRKDVEKMRPRRRWCASGRFFAYFGTSRKVPRYGEHHQRPEIVIRLTAQRASFVHSGRLCNDVDNSQRFRPRGWVQECKSSVTKAKP